LSSAAYIPSVVTHLLLCWVLHIYSAMVNKWFCSSDFLENPEATLAATGRTWKLHTEGPPGIGDQTPSCCEVTVLATKPLCSPFLSLKLSRIDKVWILSLLFCWCFFVERLCVERKITLEPDLIHFELRRWHVGIDYHSSSHYKRFSFFSSVFPLLAQLLSWHKMMAHYLWKPLNAQSYTDRQTDRWSWGLYHEASSTYPSYPLVIWLKSPWQPWSR